MPVSAARRFARHLRSTGRLRTFSHLPAPALAPPVQRSSAESVQKSVDDAAPRFRSYRLIAWLFALAFCGSCAYAQRAAVNPHIEAIRFWSFGDVTRIAIQTQGSYQITSDQVESPARLYFDLNGLRPPASAHHGTETILVGDHRLRQVRIAEVNPGTTRVVFDLEAPVDVVSSQLVNPDRLMIELRPKDTLPHELSARNGSRSRRSQALVPVASLPPATHPLWGASPTATPASAHASRARPTTSANEFQPRTPVEQSTISPALPPPDAATQPLTRASSPPATSTGVAAAAKRDSTGDRSLVRVFGLKMGKVVIDAGHGGHDTGTIGPNGLEEKNLVLDVALRLGALITRRLGAQVVYTRSEDVFIPLEDRTRIANDEKADLFISIHANSSPERSATGVETYYFNLTSDKTGLDLATRENAAAQSSISDLNDLLHKAVLETKLEESREFAQKVQASLWAASVRMNSRSRDRGVRQAPFLVLIGATMPSILAEIGFVSNPHDERLLKRSDQRQKIAEALFKGVSQYSSSLSHVQIARAGGS